MQPALTVLNLVIEVQLSILQTQLKIVRQELFV